MMRLMQAAYIVLMLLHAIPRNVSRNVFGVLLVIFVMSSPAFGASTQIDDGIILQEVADKTVTSSATLIDAADANRATLNCTNHSTTVSVRWGGSTVTASSGQRLPADRTIEIRTKGAVYMISESTNVTVSCTKEVR